MRLSMYQCMVTGFLESFLEHTNNDLRMFAGHIKNINTIQVTAKSPGSLSRIVDIDDRSYTIGSLSIQIPKPKTSLLLFSNGKLKVSGGFGEYDDTVLHTLSKIEFEEWLWINRIKPAFELMELEILDTEIEIKVFLLNASHKNTQVRCSKYISLCNFIRETYVQKSDTYKKIVMPSAFSENPTIRQKKGRIIAVKLYTDVKKKSSIHFDHSGKVQLFAFDSPSEIVHQCRIFDKIVNEFGDK